MGLSNAAAWAKTVLMGWMFWIDSRQVTASYVPAGRVLGSRTSPTWYWIEPAVAVPAAGVVACWVSRSRGAADQFRGGVDADHVHAFAGQQAAEDALAAGEVDDALVGLGQQQARRAGEDDVLVELAAGVADELVVPAGDVVPVGGGGCGRGFGGGTRALGTAASFRPV